MVPPSIADVDRVLVPEVPNAAGKAGIRFFAWSALEGQALCKPCGEADSPHSGSPGLLAKPSLQDRQNGGFESVKGIHPRMHHEICAGRGRLTTRTQSVLGKDILEDM